MPTNAELREDGSYELREDGSIELREGEVTAPVVVTTHGGGFRRSGRRRDVLAPTELPPSPELVQAARVPPFVSIVATAYVLPFEISAGSTVPAARIQAASVQAVAVGTPSAGAGTGRIVIMCQASMRRPDKPRCVDNFARDNEFLRRFAA